MRQKKGLMVRSLANTIILALLGRNLQEQGYML